MPKYLLHCVGVDAALDPPGIDLANEEAARIEAVAFAAELIRDEPSHLDDVRELKIQIRDVERRLLKTVAVRVIAAPAT